MLHKNKCFFLLNIFKNTRKRKQKTIIQLFLKTKTFLFINKQKTIVLKKDNISTMQYIFFLQTLIKFTIFREPAFA